jgi:3-dehydroquinate dehydratase
MVEQVADEMKTASFNPQRWIELLEKIAEDPDNIDIDEWYKHKIECTYLFQKLGSAMAFAFNGTH